MERLQGVERLQQVVKHTTENMTGYQSNERVREGNKVG